jgi:hypothetical protein
VVQSFGVGARTIDALDTSNNLWQYNGTSWGQLDQNVQSIGLDLGGYTLEALETNGTYRQFSA